MSDKITWIEQNVTIKSIDIPSMRKLSDSDYRGFLDGDIFYVDHGEVLRVSATGHPIATSTEQVDIMIEELTKMKDRMLPISETV